MDYMDVSTRVTPSLVISNYLSTENKEDLIACIYSGLKARQKRISSRYFYDETGSALFEEITALPEYYPSRTEKSILKSHAQAILGDAKNKTIVELGSGDCSKISILLDTIPREQLPHVWYVPVDVSESAIYKSADLLALKYRGINIHGLLADFSKHLSELPDKENRMICFFGSTIGNLSRQQATYLIQDIAGQMLPGDTFLLGLDMVKDISVLENAYNDRRGITALFNKNILHVVNEMAGTDFNPDDFKHIALYNRDKARIEMYLEARRDLLISGMQFQEKIKMKAGETIHTENSHKFNLLDIQRFSAVSGLKINGIYMDPMRWFSLVLLENKG